MKPKNGGLLDPRFKYIKASSHDAGSESFRARQRRRMAAAEAERKAQTARVVQPIKRSTAK